MPPTRDTDVVVIGAGQAGLSAAYFLSRRDFEPGAGYVLLDADKRPGGAWQHRSPTLAMRDVHGVHDLPGLALPAHDPSAPAREVVAAYFADYERRFDLPVVRPVDVQRVDDDHGRLLVTTNRGRWRARGLVNATGTWTRPFWPTYPGAERFQGVQLHTGDYHGPEPFAGQHVIVVGGGHSAMQHLAELAEVATVTWVTRRPPVWRGDDFGEQARREAVGRVEQAVRDGRRPGSVVGVTGLVETPTVQRARRLGALQRQPMFERLTEHGAVWSDGSEVRADAILWATGFRHALDHLAPLGLRDPRGGIRMDGTQVADDPRIHLLGYGPSASTIGANRAARVAVRDLHRYLDSRGEIRVA